MTIYPLFFFVQSSEAIEYINAQRSLESHGCKTPRQEERQAQAKDATVLEAVENEHGFGQVLRFTWMVNRRRSHVGRCAKTHRPANHQSSM